MSNETTARAALAQSPPLDPAEGASTAGEAMRSAGRLLRSLAATFDACDGVPNARPGDIAGGASAAILRVRAASDALASVSVATGEAWAAAQEAVFSVEGLLVVVHASLQRGFPGGREVHTNSPTADALAIAAVQADAAASRCRRAAEPLQRP